MTVHLPTDGSSGFPIDGSYIGLLDKAHAASGLNQALTRNGWLFKLPPKRDSTKTRRRHMAFPPSTSLINFLWVLNLKFGLE